MQCAGQYRKSVRKPAPIARVVIDGRENEAMLLDANFQEDWGDSLHIDTIMRHGERKEHLVEISAVEAHENDVVPFYLVSVIGSCQKKYYLMLKNFSGLPIKIVRN